MPEALTQDVTLCLRNCLCYFNNNNHTHEYQAVLLSVQIKKTVTLVVLLRCHLLLLGGTYTLGLAGVVSSNTSTAVPEKVYISRQDGASVYYYADDENTVFKEGARVRQHEEVAMRLVAEHTDVPLPRVSPDDTAFFPKWGSLGMTRILGSQLDTHWPSLDHGTKERVCTDIWSIVTKLRTIPKPTELGHLFQCSADGTITSTDPLIEPLNEPPKLDSGEFVLEGKPMESQVRRNFAEMGQHVDVGADGSMTLPHSELTDNTAIRARIYQRYLFFNGRLHAGDLPSMLPHSTRSVFTHGDLCPRNILVDRNLQIKGIVDWEMAGWYPDYWEYINMWRPSGDTDWQKYMDLAAPQKWDRKGIDAARRVLF